MFPSLSGTSYPRAKYEEKAGLARHHVINIRCFNHEDVCQARELVEVLVSRCTIARMDSIFPGLGAKIRLRSFWE